MKLLVLAVLAGCGDDLLDPLGDLVHVSGASPFATGCTGGSQPGATGRGLEVEPWLAVDPANAQHLVGVWQQDRWSTGGANGLVAGVSLDGGKTWTTSSAALGRCEGGAYERATDPWVAITPGGAVYQVGVGFDKSGAHNAVMASRSIDGGLTWDAPIELKADTDPDVFNDKDSITADPTVPDRVFATWDRITGQTHPTMPIGTGPTLLAIGTGGVWEPARPIFDPGLDAQTIGNVIVVLPDGTLVDSFALITSVSSAAPISRAAVIRSTDHGQTWSAPIDIGPMEPMNVIDAKHQIDVRSGGILPQVAVDPASGRLYVVWEDALGGVESIVMASSGDGGMTWTAPAQINQVVSANAFGPVVAARADGAVAVLYYDAREDNPDDATTFKITAWLVTSLDHGATWTEEPLTSAFDLIPAQLGTEYFLGDYQGLAAAGEVFVPFFAAAVSADDPSGIVVRPLP